MRCPKCQFDHPLQTTECLKCGIVFERYQAALDAAANQANLAPAPQPATSSPFPASPAVQNNVQNSIPNKDQKSDALRELKYRALAVPLALVGAYLLTGTGFRLAAGMLAMVLHESGHAITAWLTGTWAIPMLWVTMHGEARSWPVVLMVSAFILFGGFVAWKAERWGWVCAAGAVLLLQLLFAGQPAFTRGALIVFGGDGGALVLATILMAAFYAPRESALYKSWGLRWGLLAIGALSFMYVFRSWSGPYENIPFGEIEGVNLSDPSLLTETYGWSVIQLVDRYLRLAMFCLGALFVLYLWGLLSAYMDVRLSQPKPASFKGVSISPS